MKKKNFILFMLVMITMIAPNFVSALTEEEVIAKLENLPFKEVDGKKHLETKIVSPDIIIGDECLFTTDDYNNRYDKEDGMSSEEWISEQTNMCLGMYYNDMIKLYLKYLGYDTADLYLNFDKENPNKNKATIDYYYDTENGTEHMEIDVEISYLTDVDMKEVEKSKKILSNFKEEDRLYDLQLVNLVYHYGNLYEADYKKDAIFARYSNFKKIMEQYPEYQYVSNGGRGGGSPLTKHRVIQAGMFKDGIMYGIKQLDHYEEQILFVDKDGTGTLKEKVEERLNKYFNNKVKVDVEIGETADDISGAEWFDNYVNDFLGTDEIDAVGYEITVNINGKNIYFVVAEVPKEYVGDLYVEAHDSKTGVNVKTDSYDVPLDVRVKANDVKNNKKIKDRFDKENLVVKSAYDMSLTKSFDGTFVNKIDRGIEVYFPVDEKYKVGDKHKVYYVSETSEDKEVYDGEVVKVDGKNYVKFITNHFSTYVLASEAIENPQTLDEISNSIIISVMSFVGLCGTIYFLSRKNKSKI